MKQYFEFELEQGDAGFWLVCGYVEYIPIYGDENECPDDYEEVFTDVKVQEYNGAKQDFAPISKEKADAWWEANKEGVSELIADKAEAAREE